MSFDRWRLRAEPEGPRTHPLRTGCSPGRPIPCFFAPLLFHDLRHRIDLQNIDEHPQHHVQHITQGFDRRNGRLSRMPGKHHTRNLVKSKTFPLEDHEGLNLGICQRKAVREDLQRPTVYADES